MKTETKKNDEVQDGQKDAVGSTTGDHFEISLDEGEFIEDVIMKCPKRKVRGCFVDNLAFKTSLCTTRWARPSP